MPKLSELLLPVNGEAQRLFHGRGKIYPEFEHLSIDHFSPHLLITTYKEITDEEKNELLNDLSEFPNILLQKRFIKNEPIEILKGELSPETYAVEKSEKYLLNLTNPQNIGFFLDMGIGRDWLRSHSQGLRVLNLFSYTCSLSVAALKGGAEHVLNMDMSQKALSVGEKNHTLNGITRERAGFMGHDIMKSFGALVRKGPFDLIIIDPPTNQGESFKVNRDYHKIIRRLPDFTKEGSVIMACLNSPFLGSEFLNSAFIEYAPMFEFQELMYSSFSSQEKNPEEGLKILFFKRK
jgi:23S rRNA (cytosine1962-C5)-methyltransferase